MVHAFGWGHGMGFGFGFLNFIGTLLFIGLVILAVKVALRGPWAGGGGQGAPWRGGRGWWEGTERHPDDDAVATARGRLAAGEITPEEFGVIERGLGTAGPDGPSRWDDAVRLARLRFAKGEITLEEFEAIRKALLG